MNDNINYIIINIVILAMTIAILPKQLKEVIDDGELYNLKIIMFVFGLTLFITSCIGLCFLIFRTQGITILEPRIMNYVNLGNKLVTAILLFLIYYRKFK